MTVLLLALLWLPSPAPHAGAAVPGCRPPAAVDRTIDEELADAKTANLSRQDEHALVLHVQRDLIERYPREVEPHRGLIAALEWQDPEGMATLADSYRQEAAAHPDDALAQALAGLALGSRDTPQAIECLEKARAIAPNFPFPSLVLAKLREPGRHGTREQATKDLAAYFSACPDVIPDSTSVFHRRYLQILPYHLLDRIGSPELQATVARSLRAALGREKDPNRLRWGYEILWKLEFRTRPPQEHDAIRARVAGDLRRIEALQKRPDAEWLSWYVTAGKQAGENPDQLETRRRRLLRAFPHSVPAYEATVAAWGKENPEPDDHKDSAAWTAHLAKVRAKRLEWRRQFSDVDWSDEDLDAAEESTDTTEKDGLVVLDVWLAHAASHEGIRSYHYRRAAEFLVGKGWQPDRALDLATKASSFLDRERQARRSDNRGEDQQKQEAKFTEMMDLALERVVLMAATQLHRPAAAEPLRARVERRIPEDKELQVTYWQSRALLARLDGRTADALAYLRLALVARGPERRWYQGRPDDSLYDTARALWSELGGTEGAYQLWLNPAGEQEESPEGRWERPTKPLPDFKLADLAGRTWSLVELQGKVVLINVWATWCGPCVRELPKLQALYDRTKTRGDIQVLSLTVDDDLGLVGPFVKEKGYTFPVVPAYDYVNGVLGALSVPQNWIVDPAGRWREAQIGFDAADPDWIGTMLLRLEKAKSPQ